MNNFDISSLVKNVEELRQQMKILQESQKTTVLAQVTLAKSLVTQPSLASQTAGTHSEVTHPTRPSSVTAQY